MPTPAELKQARKTLGLTQAALAERLGVSANTVARWERGVMRIEHPAWLDRIVNDLLREADATGR